MSGNCWVYRPAGTPKPETVSPQPVEKGVKIYQFKIRVDDTDPEIWRRVEIPGDFTIALFATAVLRATGWIPNYGYTFYGPDKELIRNPSQMYFDDIDEAPAKKKKGEPSVKDAAKIKVCELYNMRKRISLLKFVSDGWMHVIELEKIKEPEGRKHYPKCTDGANACPPDDITPEGYIDLQKIMKDRKHPEYKEMKGWLADQGIKRFNVKKFNPAKVRFFDHCC
jgi:hypothetical protein